MNNLKEENKITIPKQSTMCRIFHNGNGELFIETDKVCLRITPYGNEIKVSAHRGMLRAWEMDTYILVNYLC